MSDEEWDLWEQYRSEKESFEELDMAMFAETHPNEEYIKLTDEEYIALMKEIHAA